MDHLPALLIIFSVITFLLCIQPLVWQIKHYNVASGCLISWTILLLFVNFLNASLWPSVDSVKSYMGLGLCDVEIKLIIAAWVGVTGSAAAMLRHLAKILDISSTTSLTSLSKKEKIIDRIIVYGMCVGLPFLLAATHILVQPSRYMLVSIAGCIPTVARSWPGTLFLYLLLLINGVSGTVYAALTLFRLRRYHMHITSVLHSSPSASSTSTTTSTRFNRLLALSLLILITFPLNLVYMILCATSTGLLPADTVSSVSSIHQDMDTIIVDIYGDYLHHQLSFTGTTSAVQDAGSLALIDRFSVVGLAVAVIVLLGVGKDAAKMYRKWSYAVFSRVGRSEDRRSRQQSEGASSWAGSAATSSVFAGWRMSVGRGMKGVFARRERQSVDVPETSISAQSKQTSIPSPIDPTPVEPAYMKDGITIEQREELAHPGVRRFREAIGDDSV